jgi:hypothetical protein
MTKQFVAYVLTSSARLEKVSFETVAAAEAFLASRELSQETVCLSDMITDKVVFVRSFN